MSSVLITGASKGLGRALNERYLELGWITFPLVRSDAVAIEIEQSAPSNKCHPIVADVCSADVEDAISRKLRAFGQLDLLINNAGIPGKSSGLESTTPDEAEELFRVHVSGALRVTRAAARFLAFSKDATIINISSRLGSLEKSASGEFAGKGFSYTYRIAKAAQNMLSVCLFEEFGPKGIAVAAIHPGQFVSDSSASGADLTSQEVAARITEWIRTERQVCEVRYVQPLVGALPW